MLPFSASVAIPLAWITAGFLALLGILFAVAPKLGLQATKHRAENLPTIMAGRYFFFVFVVAGIVMTGTLQQIAFVFMGLAAVAFFDAATYARAKSAVLPHIGAGIGALIVAFIALQGQGS
ncbi:MAG: hypothetical protein AAFO74_01525 [Pseudomonadota bacterium]